MTSFLGHLLLKTLLGFALISVLAVCNLAYNLLLHPLRSYPGPWYSRGSMVWYLYHTFKGDYHTAIHKLHLKYGAVVRVAPNELAYTDPQAFKDIYGHRVNTPEMMKAPSQNFSEDPRHPNIIDAPREQHSKIRRLLSNAFSDKAIREQEPILKSYMNLLMDRLHQVSSEPVNIVRWYNFTTFDVIGHLAFAESFDCLSSSDYHTWVGFIFSTVKVITWSRAFNRLFMGASSFLMRLMPKRIVRESRANFELSKEKLFRRRQKHLDYTDFLTVMISAEEKGLITIDDLLANAPILIVAGSETTATLLSGATYYLLQNPRVYNLLVQEIRAAFQAREDITMTRVNGLKYLAAVLDEALRVYPPAPSNKPRVTPPEGANIVGRFVPGNTMVGINHYSAFRHPLNFNRPDEFIPERVLQPEKPEWSKDRREVLQPFSFGPRNCIGRNLALVEMRLVMAHILFEFDLEMQQDSVGWLNQKVFTTWQKGPLMVRLRPVQR